MRGLSRRQQDTLKQLIDFNESRGYFPSVRDLCAAMAIKSTNTIQTHLRALIKKGYLERAGSQARALLLTPRAKEWRLAETGRAAGTPPATAQAPRGGRAPAGAVRSLLGTALGIPLLGSVPAGPLSEAIETYEGNLELADLLPLGEGDTFALTAAGDSMRDKGIYDGDILVVRQQADADSGDIVVALLDGETTVKTLIRRVDGLTLQPANDAVAPIRIALDHPHFQVCGKVVGVIRRL